MSSTVPPSQLLAGRVMLSVATALLLSAAASVMGAAPPARLPTAPRPAVSHTRRGARQARRPRSRRSRAHAAGGELEPSLCSGARTGSPGCAQVLLQCALALGLAAFGVVVVAGKLQVSAPSLLSSAQCSAHGPVACRSQPISLSAMMDGASASFEDFNPDFMVRCLPILSMVAICICAAYPFCRLCHTVCVRLRDDAAPAALPFSLADLRGRAGVQVFHGRRATQAK